MVTISACEESDETNHERERTISPPTEQFQCEEESTEEIAQVENGTLRKIMMMKKFVSTNRNEVLIERQNQIELHSMRIHERSMTINRGGNCSEQFPSSVFNIFVNSTSTKIDSSTVSSTARAILQPQVNGCNNCHNGEGTSSQGRILGRIAPNPLSDLLSTNLRNMSFNFCDNSDILNNVNENNSISSNRKAIRQRNNTDIDVSDLSDVSISEISSEYPLSNGTQNIEPAIEVGNENERPSENQVKRAKKKSKANLDKDFVSVTPKLQNKLLSLIKRQIVNVNTYSYKNIKSKVTQSKYKNLINYHKSKWDSIRKHNNSLGEPNQGCELNGHDESDDYIPEVIDLSDSDTPEETSYNDRPAEKGDNDTLAEKSNENTPTEKNNKKKVKSTRKKKKKRKVKSTKKRKDVNSSEKVPRKGSKKKGQNVNSSEKVPGEDGKKKGQDVNSSEKVPGEDGKKKGQDVNSSENVPGEDGKKKGQDVNSSEKVPREDGKKKGQDVNSSEKVPREDDKKKGQDVNSSENVPGEDGKKKGQNVNSSDVPREDGKKKPKVRKVSLKKWGIIRKRKPQDRKCKVNKEQYLNWVKRVAFAKACELEPKLYLEKEREIALKSRGTIQNNRLFPCMTPRRPNMSNRNSGKCSSGKISSAKSRPGTRKRKPAKKNQALTKGNKRNQEICSPKQRQENENQVLASENMGNQEICSPRQVQASGSQVLASENMTNQEISSPRQVQANESQVLASENNESQVLASEDMRNQETRHSKVAQRLESRLEPLSASGNSNDAAMHQNDNQVSDKTSESLADASQLQPTVCEERGTVDKSVVNSETTEEIRKKWLASLALYEKKEDSKQNKTEQDSLSCSEKRKKQKASCNDSRKSFSHTENGVKYIFHIPGSPKEEKKEENCAVAVTPNGGKDLESSNNLRCMTSLAENYTFSDISHKVRVNRYKDRVTVFFPDKDKSNNSQVPRKPNNVAKGSHLGDQPRKRPLSGDVSNVQTSKRKKEKDKCDRFKNADKADENLNPSLKEPVKGLSSPTEKLHQKPDPPVLTQEKEALSEINLSPTRTPFIPMLNNIQSNNEKNVNFDGSNVPVSDNYEKVSDGFNFKEPWGNSGIETTHEKIVILQEDGPETDDQTNEFREIKKKFKLLHESNLPVYNIQTNNVLQSPAAHLETSRKILYNRCMAQNKIDKKKLETAYTMLELKRRRNPNPSASNSVSVKKAKESHEKDENSNKGNDSNKKKVFSGDDYIPLDASGPTKFAVAPLDKVIPYREHGAKDFKSNMLYGDRVTRFSSAKSLEIYKAKQKASQKKSSY